MTELGAGARLIDERYRLDALLGTGGMATVWSAYDERLQRSVALKVLSDTLALDETFVERFRREAQIAAGLSHPNLVRVYDFGDHDGRPFLVMERVAGPTLAERLRDGRSPAAGAVARELLDALAHIHAAGIVHRDIKPANVLIDADGRALLTDFGVAQPQDATRLTSTGMVVGTLRYLAPELVAGERASVRSDLYSLGRLLEELRAPPDELVARLTAHDPAARPASAAAALASLERTEPTTVRRRKPRLPTVAQEPRVGKLARSRGRERRLAAVAGLVTVLVLVIVALARSGGDGGHRALAPPPASSAPLSQQLDAIGRAVHDAAH